MTREEVIARHTGCEKCGGKLFVRCVIDGERICTLCVRDQTEREIIAFGRPLPAWTKRSS